MNKITAELCMELFSRTAHLERNVQVVDEELASKYGELMKICQDMNEDIQQFKTWKHYTYECQTDADEDKDESSDVQSNRHHLNGDLVARKRMCTSGKSVYTARYGSSIGDEEIENNINVSDADEDDNDDDNDTDDINTSTPKRHCRVDLSGVLDVDCKMDFALIFNDMISNNESREFIAIFVSTVLEMEFDDVMQSEDLYSIISELSSEQFLRLYILMLRRKIVMKTDEDLKRGREQSFIEKSNIQNDTLIESLRQHINSQKLFVNQSRSEFKQTSVKMQARSDKLERIVDEKTRKIRKLEDKINHINEQHQKTLLTLSRMDGVKEATDKEISNITTQYGSQIFDLEKRLKEQNNRLERHDKTNYDAILKLNKDLDECRRENKRKDAEMDSIVGKLGQQKKINTEISSYFKKMMDSRCQDIAAPILGITENVRVIFSDQNDGDEDIQDTVTSKMRQIDAVINLFCKGI